MSLLKSFLTTAALGKKCHEVDVNPLVDDELEVDEDLCRGGFFDAVVVDGGLGADEDDVDDDAVADAAAVVVAFGLGDSG